MRLVPNCIQFYDQLFRPVESDDASHNEALSGHVAALNMLDLSLDHLGVDAGSGAQEAQVGTVVKKCGEVLQQLSRPDCQTASQKSAILVDCHRTIVDGLGRLQQPVKLKSESETPPVPSARTEPGGEQELTTPSETLSRTSEKAEREVAELAAKSIHVEPRAPPPLPPRPHASQAVDDGIKIIVLSDRQTGPQRVPLSALVACGGVHHHLVQHKKRAKVALMVETAEAREVHHLCMLVGYGADAICPYLAMEAIMKVHREGLLRKELSLEKLIYNFRKACDEGILKVMSKMGISTLQSYKGAQIFDALGLHQDVIDKCFCNTASRVQGATFELLAMDAFEFHERGYPTRETLLPRGMPESGEYHWRDGGEAHINDPAGIANLQDAVREKNQSAYDAYSRNALEMVRNVTLRGLVDFTYDEGTRIPIEQVEPWNQIVRRFVTGAMLYGSISMEAHSTLAVAMNCLGGKSNTGEGGEDAECSERLPNGDTMRSAIKQVASGRFGVTSNYLADSDELQIKMASTAP
ncbi:hypothetical protein BKA62DRAFT_767512 [Auriculariales sp. MPI-PUGE-AT-0066]|nr:hypothetical protein BKA62DRAFT_767512 [Auriculariales sp. MPI-PUGE-AT-0066]